LNCFFFKIAVVRRVKYLEIRIFNCRYGSEGQDASPCQSVKPLLKYGDFDVLFKMAIIAILDLLYAFLDHPQRVFAGFCQCVKFGWIRCSIFDNMQVLILVCVRLEIAFSLHQNEFFWYFNPRCGEQYQRDL